MALVYKSQDKCDGLWINQMLLETSEKIRYLKKIGSIEL